MSKKVIAFVPGAFRPFGAHHMKLVEHYADMCDEVVVVISNPKDADSARKTNAGTAITPEQAKEIVDLCLKDSGLDNVTSIVSSEESPVREILRDIAKLRDCSVMLGVGTKDADPKRFASIKTDYFKDNNVDIYPPEDTAFAEVDDDGVAVSASDIRGHVSDRDMLRSYLPVFVEDDTFQRIYDILNGKSRDRVDSHDELKFGASIFEELLNESVESEADDGLCETEEVDEEETEFSRIRLDDQTIADSDCGIIAYNTQVAEGEGEAEAYTPKNFPDKAIDIEFKLPDGNEVEIFLDPETKEWDSTVNDGAGKLSPDQMGEFFGTDFCRRVTDRVSEMWPESDPYFRDLLEAVRRKKINIEPVGTVTEDSNVFRKGNIDKEKSREKNAAGRQTRTRSGRKLISPSDFDVKHDENEAYYVWPPKDKEFKWSSWADWNKLRPCARARFRVGSWVYGVSFSPFLEDNDNRGAKAYNLDLEPKLQYLTPEETQEMMGLSIMRKFLRNATKRIVRYTSIPDEEIYRRVGRPDKCTLDDIRKTKHVMKNTLKAIRNGRADTYIYD